MQPDSITLSNLVLAFAAACLAVTAFFLKRVFEQLDHLTKLANEHNTRLAVLEDRVKRPEP